MWLYAINNLPNGKLIQHNNGVYIGNNGVIQLGKQSDISALQNAVNNLQKGSVMSYIYTNKNNASFTVPTKTTNSPPEDYASIYNNTYYSYPSGFTPVYVTYIGSVNGTIIATTTNPDAPTDGGWSCMYIQCILNGRGIASENISMNRTGYNTKISGGLTFSCPIVNNKFYSITGESYNDLSTQYYVGFNWRKWVDLDGYNVNIKITYTLSYEISAIGIIT